MSASQPVKASFWFTVCNIVNKGLALLATPILTRIMTTDQYGTFAVFQSWVAIFTIFCTLNLFQNAYSRGIIQFKGHRERFCSSLLGLSTFLTVILALVFCVMADFWSPLLLMPPLLIVLMFVEIALVTAYEFWAATQRFDYKYKALVVVSIAINVISLGVGIAAILCTEYKVEARVVADVLAKGLPGLVLTILIFSRGKCFFDKSYWKYALAFNLPLLPHFLSHYVLGQSNRLMIGAMVGNDMAALYSVAYSIAMTMTIVVTAINSSYVPYTYKEIAAGRIEGIKRSSLPILVLVLALCILVMAFAPEVLFVFAGPEYASAVYIIPPLASSVFFIFLYSLFSNIEYYYKRTGIISFASVICAVLNIGLNLVAIPLWGYEAAAWATLISYIALSLFHWVFCRRICRKEFSTDAYPSKAFALLSGVAVVATFCMLALCDVPAARYSIVFVIGLAMLVKRNKIMAIVGRKG